jgi:hypothetical protein
MTWWTSIHNSLLVGGWAYPLKNMTNRQLGRMTSHIWKIKVMFEATNQTIFYLPNWTDPYPNRLKSALDMLDFPTTGYNLNHYE